MVESSRSHLEVGRLSGLALCRAAFSALLGRGFVVPKARSTERAPRRPSLGNLFHGKNRKPPTRSADGARAVRVSVRTAPDA